MISARVLTTQKSLSCTRMTIKAAVVVRARTTWFKAHLSCLRTRNKMSFTQPSCQGCRGTSPGNNQVASANIALATHTSVVQTVSNRQTLKLVVAKDDLPAAAPQAKSISRTSKIRGAAIRATTRDQIMEAQERPLRRKAS